MSRRRWAVAVSLPLAVAAGGCGSRPADPLVQTPSEQAALNDAAATLDADRSSDNASARTNEADPQ